MTTNCIVCKKVTHKKTCKGCNQVSFCSVECIQSGLKLHKLTCSSKVNIKKSTACSGKGVFAKQTFSVGDELFRDELLIRFPINHLSSDMKHNIQLWNKLLSERPPEIRDCIMNFTNVRTDISIQENIPTTYGIFKTNFFHFLIS